MRGLKCVAPTHPITLFPACVAAAAQFVALFPVAMSVQVGLRYDIPGRLSFLGSLYRSAPMTRLLLPYLRGGGRGIDVI